MSTLVWPIGLAAAWLSPAVLQAQPVAPLPPVAWQAAPVAPSPAAAPQAGPAAALTLDRALALALSRSFTLSAAQREVDAADGDVLQAGTRPNPALNAQVEDTRRATRTTIATLDLPIELGGKRAARVAAAERQREVAQAELTGAEAALRATVVAAYFATAVAQERAQLAADSAALAGNAADAVQRRVAAGKVSPVDATRARVDQANAQLEQAEAEAALQSAREALAASWGDAAPAFTTVAADTTQVPQRGTVAELAAQLDAAPALRTSRAEAERRRALVGVERSKAVPDVTLSVGAQRDNELGRTQAIVGVSIPLPLFDRNQGSIHAASQQARRADDQHQQARIQLLHDLQQASRQLAVARAALDVLRSTVLPAAEQAHAAATRGFAAGKFGFLDVIDAQRTLLQARARSLSALSSAFEAATTIDRLLGH